jgi:hypothetical protein
MNTDRQEQAKANSEQEIQAALDYIARDLQQAIYIYDADGIEAIKDKLPDRSPTTKTDRVPVLVFWKRELVSQAITVGSQKDDTFVYSLVAYYLIKDSSSNWSKAARIARWQIKDGVADPSSTKTCGKYLQCPDPGFAAFKLDGIGTLAEKMNAWTKATADYTADTIVLVDFIDQTRNDDVPPAPVVTCPSNPPSPAPPVWSQVPQDITSFNTRGTVKMTSFSVCIDTVDTTAQVFIRGNAVARIENDSTKINYSPSKSAYFPTASVRVQGRGYLYTK